MKHITAVNMSTGQEVNYSIDDTKTLTPYQDAAIRAYAQLTIGDYSWWAYDGRYFAEMGHHHAFCGDWAVRLPR